MLSYPRSESSWSVPMDVGNEAKYRTAAKKKKDVPFKSALSSDDAHRGDGREGSNSVDDHAE